MTDLTRDALDAALAPINAKLDALIGAAQRSVEPAPAHPWEVPELTPDLVTAFDGVTEQADGSVWTRNIFNGQPEGVIYGYISKAKNPAMWARMVAVFGGDEVRLQSILDDNGRDARYKLHPEAVLHQGASSFNLLSGLILSAPIRRVV